MRLALAALLLAWSTLTAAVAPTPLDASAVDEFIARFGAAERAGDVAAIGAALAPDCHVEMRTTTGGREHVMAMSHDEYLADLGEYYGSLRDVPGYAYRSGPARVTLIEGTAAADASWQGTETYDIDGKRRVFHVDETTRIELRDDRLVIATLAIRSHLD